MRYRFFKVWLLIGLLATASCNPARKDDQDEDEKKEHKDKRHTVPLIIIQALKLIFKLVNGKDAQVIAYGSGAQQAIVWHC